MNHQKQTNTKMNSRITKKVESTKVNHLYFYIQDIFNGEVLHQRLYVKEDNGEYTSAAQSYTTYKNEQGYRRAIKRAQNN